MVQGFLFTEPRKNISARICSGSPKLLELFEQFISSFLVPNTRLHFCLHTLQGPPPMGRKMRTYSHYGICKTHWVFNDFQAESCCESDAQSQQRVQEQYSCNKIKITKINLQVSDKELKNTTYLYIMYQLTPDAAHVNKAGLSESRLCKLI